MALIEEGDTIIIDIPKRLVQLDTSGGELQKRWDNMEVRPDGWTPQGERTRVVTKALRAYAAFATSADKGGVREI